MKTQIQTTFTLILVCATFLASSQDALFDRDQSDIEGTHESSSLFSGEDEPSFLDKGHAEGTPGRFSEINLNELRKTVLTQLMKDNLIRNKREVVYLFLREDGITFNDQKLNNELNLKYTNLLAPYKIGTGPDRTLFFSHDCTAVGDFTENKFYGKMKGRLRIEYTTRKFGF